MAGSYTETFSICIYLLNSGISTAYIKTKTILLFSECERCFKTSTTCLHHNGKCFQIFNRKVTWYRARQLCKAQTREGDLAVTKEVTFVKRLSRKAHRHLSGEVRLFWVGKRTTDYEAGGFSYILLLLG